MLSCTTTPARALPETAFATGVEVCIGTVPLPQEPLATTRTAVQRVFKRPGVHSRTEMVKRGRRGVT